MHSSCKETTAVHRIGSTSFAFRFCSALAALALLANFSVASALTEEVLPHLCDSVHCPPLEDIVCPPDSDVRESFVPPAGAAASVAVAIITNSVTAEAAHHVNISNGDDSINEELFTQCCVAPKCLCRTCYVPDCHSAELVTEQVIYELTPESMDTPGKCCGTYECRPEPKCSEVHDTESYWLTNCQRCKCFSGERICHQSCDEGARKSTAICNSKTLNRFFENGETWRHGCYECECVNGEEKCVLPFCRSVNCPQERQVLVKDSCCPICWPANITMPNAQDVEYDEEQPLSLPDVGGYDDSDDDEEGDEDESEGNRKNDDGRKDDAHDDSTLKLRAEASENQLDLLPNILLNTEVNETTITTMMTPTTTTTSTTTTTTTTRTTTPTPTPTLPSTSINVTTDVSLLLLLPSSAPAVVNRKTNIETANSSTGTPSPTAATTSATTAAPCHLHSNHEAPATYHVYPEVVEVVRQTQPNDLLYAVIGCLALAVVLLVGWNVHLRAKQRSYRPVSNFDDNFNKTSTTSNIKKMNDYV